VIDFSEATLQSFEYGLKEKLTSIVTSFEHGLVDGEVSTEHRLEDYFPPNFTACNKQYGMCGFANVCRVSNESKESVIQNEFVPRVYDPLLFQA
jgi:hypothetical protein